MYLRPASCALSTASPSFAVGLGWGLASADHDGDGTDDLIATAVFGQNTDGAAVVFYGGTVPTGNVRISDVSSAESGTTVMRMYQQPGIHHRVLDYSDDYTVIEITSPADFETVTVAP